MGSPHWVLANAEPQEFKPTGALGVCAGLGDPSFAWLQFQSHVLQPGFEHPLCSLHAFLRRVEHHQIIGVANGLGFSFFHSKGSFDGGFQPVKRHIH